MVEKISVQRSRFESSKRNILKKIRLFSGAGIGDLSLFSSRDEDMAQPIGYPPHAYALLDKRLREIEAQKAMALARTQRLTF